MHKKRPTILEQARSMGTPIGHYTDSGCLVSADTARDAKRAGCSNDEALDLGASEIACAVADAIARMSKDGELTCCLEFMTPAEYAALKRLEAATAGSAMRKVRAK